MAKTEKKDVREIALPKGLDAPAKKEFERLKPQLLALGYLEIDEAALVQYLTHFSLCVKARAQLKKKGPIITTPKGQVQINPWHSVLKMNSELLKKWVQELGFSPGSRKRLGVKLDDGEETDLCARL